MGATARAPDDRPAEGRAARLAFAHLFALLESHDLLRPIREEMGIRGGVGALRWTFTASLFAPARRGARLGGALRLRPAGAGRPPRLPVLPRHALGAST